MVIPGNERVSFNLEIALRSDFADIFEVESRKFVRRGRIETKWDGQKQQLSTSYTNGEFYRCLIYQPYDCTSQPYYANGRISFEIKLDAGQTWQTSCKYILIDNNHVREPVNLTYNSAINPDTINTEIERLHADWTNSVTDITFTHPDMQRLYRQSIEDIGALRLYDYDAAPDVWIPGAGVPKFVTLFGRDSLIVSLQNMIVHPSFARGALQKLAQLQATAIDDWRIGTTR